MATPASPYPSAPPPVPAAKNGFGTTALVLGIIGILVAWIPIIGFLGFVLGGLAIVFGGIAVYRAHAGKASNKVMSYFGLALGIAAFVISLVTWGAFVGYVDEHVDQPYPAGSGGAAGAPAAPGPIQPGTIPGDGTFLVGTDVQPGTYRSDAGSYGCYYARLSDTSGAPGSIITNNLSQGPLVVTIDDSDAAFETRGCRTWTAVG